MREQRQPLVPLAILQLYCDLHRDYVSSLSVNALASLTGSRRSNGLSGGSRNEGIVLLLELTSQACGEGMDLYPWETALRSVRVLDREKGSTAAEYREFGEEAIMMKKQVSCCDLSLQQCTHDES